MKKIDSSAFDISSPKARALILGQREGSFELSATRIFNKPCAERIVLPACRTRAFMKVQECLKCPQPPLFSGGIMPVCHALFRPLKIQLFDELNHDWALHTGTPLVQANDVVILRPHRLTALRPLD
jgi:hypothetical protein